MREREEKDRKERGEEENRAREKYIKPYLLVLFPRKDLYIRKQWQK